MWFRRIRTAQRIWLCFGCLLGLRLSIWEAAAAHEVLKAWFGTEGIKTGSTLRSIKHYQPVGWLEERWVETIAVGPGGCAE